MREGQGRMEATNGNIYDGSWLRDKKHFKGKQSYSNGGEYEGQWVNGKREGRGMHVYVDGKEYTGEWQNNKRHGKGCLLTFAPHATKKAITGTTPTSVSDERQRKKEGKESGLGMSHQQNLELMKRKPKERYEGEWAEDRKDGEGAQWYASGAHYSGGWKANKKEGYGVYTFADGRTYGGQWQKGKYHGRGRLQYKTGEVYEGVCRVLKWDRVALFLHLVRLYRRVDDIHAGVQQGH